MKIHRVIWVLVTPLIAAGCENGHGFTAEPTIAMVGFARDSLIANGSTRKPLKLGEFIETDGIVAFKANTDDQVWKKVLLGASTGVQKEKGIGRFLQGSLLFSLQGGWVYIYGDEPQVETGRVSAGAEGSAILVHIDPDANVHRVYFLGGAAGKVTKKSDGSFKCFATANTFIEAPTTGPLTGPTSIPGTGPIKDFKDEVVRKADIFFTP